ncbi:hypothetical protein BDW60DRAFT_199561 [Aspergillus nidulans var. acristatus]
MASYHSHAADLIFYINFCVDLLFLTRPMMIRINGPPYVNMIARYCGKYVEVTAFLEAHARRMYLVVSSPGFYTVLYVCNSALMLG